MAEQSAYRPNALVAPWETAQTPGAVDRVNELLKGTVVGPPRQVNLTALALMPVVGDARQVVARLREIGGADPLARQLDIDPLLRAATFEGGAQDQKMHPAKDIGHLPGSKTLAHGAADKNIGHLVADKNIGHLVSAAPPPKNIGHATVAWRSFSSEERPPPRPAATSEGRRVIALLDTEVASNQWWLGVDNPSDPFVVDAEQLGWQPLDPLPGDLGSHFGHGTFNAGVLRRYAPAAKVLSIGLMSSTGLVSEVAVIAAIEWLRTQVTHVVLMPFSRRETDGDNGLTRDHLKKALDGLVTTRTRIVAAAGSDGQDHPTYPAAFGSPVISVGSGLSASRYDHFSNHGDWVEQWAAGAEAVSVLPVTTIEGAAGHATWSGTSFAAARYAATLAQPS